MPSLGLRNISVYSTIDQRIVKPWFDPNQVTFEEKQSLCSEQPYRGSCWCSVSESVLTVTCLGYGSVTSATSLSPGRIEFFIENLLQALFM